MTSIQRTFAQRHTNMIQIVPEYTDYVNTNGPAIDISSVVYTLNLPSAQFTGGDFFVDLSGVDTSGNLLDVSDGVFVSHLNSDVSANLLLFHVNAPVNPGSYPGLEFTIYFRNIPIDRIEYGAGPIPLFSIGLVQTDTPIPYIMTPVLPAILNSPNTTQSVTFKSDGINFNVVSSGPAGWLGAGLFSIIISGFGYGG